MVFSELGWEASLIPDEDLHFRLVEGHARLVGRPNLKLEVLTKVQLNRMTRFDGQVIEHFTYQLSSNAAPDQVFFEGVALFGYFQSGPRKKSNAIQIQIGQRLGFPG